MPKVRKAVITAAGRGTRQYPREYVGANLNDFKQPDPILRDDA